MWFVLFACLKLIFFANQQLHCYEHENQTLDNWCDNATTMMAISSERIEFKFICLSHKQKTNIRTMILQTQNPVSDSFFVCLILLIRTHAPNDGGQYVNSYNTRARA